MKVDCSFVPSSFQCLYTVKITDENWDYEFVLVTNSLEFILRCIRRKTVSNGGGVRLFFFSGTGGREKRDPVRTKAAILIRVLQRNQAIRIYIQKKMYYKKLAHTVMETDKSQDLQLAS